MNTTSQRLEEHKKALRKSTDHLRAYVPQWYDEQYSHQLHKLTYDDQEQLVEVVSYVASECGVVIRTKKRKQALANLLLNLKYCNHTTNSEGCIKLATKDAQSGEGAPQYAILGCGGQLLRKLISALVESNVIVHKRGYKIWDAGVTKSNLTKIKLTELGEALLASLDPDLILAWQVSPVVWRAHKEDGKKIPSEALSNASGAQVLINSTLALVSAGVTYKGVNVRPESLMLERQFSNAECTEHGRIYYALLSDLQREERKDLRIAGEELVEIDIKSAYALFAYGLVGKDLTAKTNEAYWFSGMRKACFFGEHPIGRELCKAIFQVLLNVGARHEEHLARIATQTIRHSEKHIETLERAKKVCPNVYRELKVIVKGVIENNKALLPVFCQERGKAFKQISKIESDILVTILSRCLAQGIPVLPQHDGVAVAEKHKLVVAELFRKEIVRSLSEVQFKKPELLMDYK